VVGVAAWVLVRANVGYSSPFGARMLVNGWATLGGSTDYGTDWPHKQQL